MTSWAMPDGRSLVCAPATCAARRRRRPPCRGRTVDAVGADDVDGVALHEATADVDHAGRQQARPALDERPLGARRRPPPCRRPGGEGDPQLARRQLAACASNVVPTATRGDGPGEHARVGPASAITLRTPDHDAIRAASSLLAMPPLPRPLPPLPARSPAADRRPAPARRARPSGRARGSAVYRPVGVGEQHEQVGADVVRDERGDAVVVAVARLVVGDRIVLVDDRHAAELEQPPSASAGRAGTAAGRRSRADEQHLRGDEPVRAERRVVARISRPCPAAEIACSVACRSAGSAARAPHPRRDGTRRHDDDLVAVGAHAPRPRRTAWRSPRRRSRPRSSVIDEVPILTTARARRQRSLVVEAELADPDDVALLRAGPGEHLGTPSRSRR